MNDSNREEKECQQNLSSKKLSEIRPWDYKTKNEYEDVTVRQQPYVHTHYRHVFDEKRF